MSLYRVEVADEYGVAHSGPAYDDAWADLVLDATGERPDPLEAARIRAQAVEGRVVTLVIDPDSGEGSWEAVD